MNGIEPEPDDEEVQTVPEIFIIDDYAIEMGAVQDDTGAWRLFLQMYTGETEPGDTRPKQVFIVHGKMDYDAWEYALDEGFNIVESLGFKEVTKEHEFDVIFYAPEQQNIVVRTATFDGNQFTLVDTDESDEESDD